MTESHPPLPPFTLETAIQKVRMAEDAWNTRNPQRVALAYTSDSRWRNRVEFLQGREAIEQFLTRKWQRELDYRLIKEIWAFRENRIAVRFAYEWHDDSGNWFRFFARISAVFRRYVAIYVARSWPHYFSAVNRPGRRSNNAHFSLPDSRRAAAWTSLGEATAKARSAASGSCGKPRSPITERLGFSEPVRPLVPHSGPRRPRQSPTFQGSSQA